MRWFLLLFLVGMAGVRALHATPVAVANCVLGIMTEDVTTNDVASCSLGKGDVDFETSVEELISFNGLSVSAELGGYVNNNFISASPAYSTGQATDNLTLTTPGPPRSGIIQYSHSGQGLASIGGIDLIDYQTGSSVFELGVPFVFSFQVSWGCGDHICPEIGSEVSFTLFEADAATPVPINNTAPEPANWGLVLFGLVFYGWFRVLKTRSWI